jgi:hypothetical protein
MESPARVALFPGVAAFDRSIPRTALVTTVLCLLLTSHWSSAQVAAPQQTPQQELQRLTQAVAQAQAQVEASQQQLLELKKSLAALEQRLANENPANPAPSPQLAASPAEPTPPAHDDDLHERQVMQASQIATLNQIKVESESKYPVKISGMILLNGFVNTSAVDQPPAPTVAVAGSGSTGASLRQTVLGIDARGPSLAGATSHADLRVDFFGNGTQTTYADAGGILRLRTAHATLDWSHTQAFVELDRPIISPNAPTSLTAVAEPALAWSGNLWTWAPQLGISHTLDLGASARLELKAALIDVPDPPTFQTTTTSTATQAQNSRWPGAELHLGLLGKQDGAGPSFGVGGYFSPHQPPGGDGYNAWAGTLDMRVPLPLGLELSGSFYRGLALGGLGGGGFKDYLSATYNGYLYTRPLDDVGGWAQLKKHAGPRLEFNAAFGLDNAFSGELRQYAYTSPIAYQSLARNRTFFANSIYSPSSYLMFSLEYRHLISTPVAGAPSDSHVIGVAAGYRF